MRRSAGVLAVIGAALALAAPVGAQESIRVDVPAALERQITLAAPRTDVPIRLPRRIDAERAVFPQLITAVRRRWTMDLAYARNCRGATACFFASFSGRIGTVQSGRRTPLAKGKVGFYRPGRCAANCTPPRIEWRQGGFVYGISANVLPDQLFRLRILASQAIVHRPVG